MRKYIWLLFDADGTLFDYDKAEKFALEATFEQLGYPFEAQYLPTYRSINSQIWLDFEQGKITQKKLKTKRFELLLKAVNIHAGPQEFSTTYLANLAKGTYLIDGTEEIIRTLYKRFKLAIITNGLTRVQRPRLKNSSIYKYIKEIIISEEIGAAKPHKKIFDIAFERMHHPARSEVLLIGDSLTSDIQGGNNYGINTCWFNPERKPSCQTITGTFEIHTLDELLSVVEENKTRI
jgi:YjjG family noncanonical pyrimidine nucleotidase